MTDSPDAVSTASRPISDDLLRTHPIAGLFIRANFDHDRPLRGATSTNDDAAAWITRGWDPPHHEWLYIVGAPEAASALGAELAATDPGIVGITVERSIVTSLPSSLVPSGDPWDWWSTDQAPAPRGAEDQVTFDDGSDPVLSAEIQELLHIASPDHWAPPGHPRVAGWAVLRDPSTHRLVACAADTRPGASVPHLASVATHPDHRGRGHAKTVVAAITRRLFAQGAGSVTLGMHATNDAARRVYTDLGFRVRYAWLSGRIPPRAPNEVLSETPRSLR